MADEQARQAEEQEGGPGRVLSHFAGFRFGDRFWELGAHERRELVGGLARDLRQGGVGAARVELYQLYPSRSDVDLLLWSALPADDPAAPGRFFERFARVVAHRRPGLVPSHTFWGLTRPSPYTGRGGSSRQIDAVEGERARYLIVYPFSKTAPWYLRPAEERGEMMREHIRIGRQFEGVRQLLLYSFGLQDQELVVVYETEDLAGFSDLVYALRSTEARAFTALDTPVLTGLHLPQASADRSNDESGDAPRAPWF